MKVYIDRRDWWVGYYRGDTHHYVCLLPTVVIRWRRSLGDAPCWSDGDPWLDWTLVEHQGERWAVYSRLRPADEVVTIPMLPPGTPTEAVIDALDPVTGQPGYTMRRQVMRLPSGAHRWGPHPPHYVRGFGRHTERTPA
jgi:hypothetical protein